MSDTNAAQASYDWLPDLVEFASRGGDWDAYVELLYGHFRHDFMTSQPSFPGRRWANKRHPIYEGKEATFWHIISEGLEEDKRLPDLRRCERIRWPRCVIDACQTGRVRCWVQFRRHNEKRVALATEDFSYLVVLADRGETILLWTAFPIEREHRRRKLEKEYVAFRDSIGGRAYP